MTSHDEEESGSPSGQAHGQLSYLQIPATDVVQSAAFYETVFGWRIERPYPEFEVPGLIGQWVSDRPVAPDGGLVAWINVDTIDESLDLVRANGGRVLEAPSPDGPERLLAAIADPAGNAVGIVQHGPH
ncbi:MAG TPA: VOC family protein [Actinomycetota bacterium]|nr:VOC family protein [Actinomycetota bacterium]